MGEYAIRKSDGQNIKIGTCESMYYIRFEDRDKVRSEPNSISLSNPAHVDGLRFRLPFPDEDNLEPGQYDDYNRGIRLYKVLPCDWCKGTGKIQSSDIECTRCHGARTYGHEDYAPEDTLDHPGRMYFHHDKSGLQFSIPCYHGMKLPELGEGIKPCWNGKGYAFELSSLKAMRIEQTASFRVVPVIRCRFCDEEWRSEWSDVADYLPEDWRFLLDRYADQKYSIAA